MIHLNLLLNLMDHEIGLENIRTYGIDKSKKDNFLLWLRFFQTILIYGIYYGIAKIIQFVISLLLKVPIENINMIYFVLPIFILMGIGASSLNSINITNFGLFTLRALIQFGLIYLFDLMLIPIIK